MKRRMVWAWPLIIEGVDERNRPTKDTHYVFEPNENKPIKVALYLPKEDR